MWSFVVSFKKLIIAVNSSLSLYFLAAIIGFIHLARFGASDQNLKDFILKDVCWCFKEEGVKDCSV